MELLSESATLELVGHYGRLHARLRRELGAPTLVLPTNEHFPDRFDGTEAAATRLVQRMQRHAAIEDIPVRVTLSQPEASGGNSCSSGACSTFADTNDARLELGPDGWTLTLTPGEISHPVALTGAVARALGAVFLEETRQDGAPLPQPFALASELCAVQLGFGVLLLEASHLYTKACSGPRITQLTLLSAPELAVLVALYAAEHRIKLKPALKACSLTQRERLTHAADQVRSNASLVTWIARATPDEPTPSLTLNEAKPALFAGLFGRSSKPTTEPEDLQAWLDAPTPDFPVLPRQSSTRSSTHSTQSSVPKPDDELKALIAEALSPNAPGR